MDVYDFTASTGAHVSFDKDAICCIVQVPLSVIDGPFTFNVLGTGFHMFNSRIVITAKHLFTDADEDAGPIFVMGLNRGDRGGLPMAYPESTYLVKSADLALLVLPDEPSTKMVPFLPGPHDYQPSGGVFSIGYRPSQSEISSTQCRWHCHLQIEHAAIAHIEERERAGTKSEFCISYSNPFAECGNSGGPLLNAAGRVVGVVSEQFSVATSSDEQPLRTSARAVSLHPLMKIWKEIPGLSTIPSFIVDWWFGDNPETIPQELWENMNRD